MNTKIQTISSLHLPSWYPSRVNPTLGNFIQKHLEALSRSGQIVWVIYVVRDLNAKLSLSRFEVIQNNENGVHVIRLYYNSWLPLYGVLMAYFLGIQSFLKQFREEGYKPDHLPNKPLNKKPDLIHLHVLQKASLPAYLLSKLWSIPLFYTEHWTGFLPENKVFNPKKLKNKLLVKIANRAKVRIPVTAHLKNAMKGFGINGKYEIINNVVDTKTFVGKPSGMNIGLEHSNESAETKITQFIHISHLQEKHKNFTGLLNGFQKLKEKGIPFHLTIVSDSDLKQPSATIQQFGFTANELTLIGSSTTNEVAALMQQSDCLVLFSRFENFPCVIAEAFAVGIPVISSNVGGISEHLDHYKGILIKTEDVQDLTWALESIVIGNHILKTGTKGTETILSRPFDPISIRQYAIEHFSYEAVCSKIISVYSMFVE